jgi:TM2 domain-containing membrane protein YozV
VDAQAPTIDGVALLLVVPEGVPVAALLLDAVGAVTLVACWNPQADDSVEAANSVARRRPLFI